MRPIPQIAIDFLKQHEGCVLKAYEDAGGVLTAGYGHTGDVVSGQAITQADADAWLADDASIAASRLEAVTDEETVSALTEFQYAALISFVFNLGANPKWTIWKRLKARQFDQVPGEMAKFVNVGDQKVQGLVNRRAAEAVLWATQEPGTQDASPPSSVTRSRPTPPTPSAPGRSKAVIYGSIAAVTSAGPTIDHVRDAMQRYSGHSHYVDMMLAGLATAGAVCAGLAILYTVQQARNARN